MAYHIEIRRKLLLAVLAVAAIGCQVILEATKGEKRVSGYKEKSAAAEVAATAFDALREHRREAIDWARDPAGTGLVGPKVSPITNAASRLADKRTTLNPNFAAIIVDYFQQVGLREGDPVAVAISGSFPGMGVNLFAAMEALKLRPTIITSVGASNWGATDPQFTWLDVERVLSENGIIHFRSAAASPGGSDDMGNSLTETGRQMVWDAIERNGVEPLRSRNLDESIEKRMQIYHRGAGGDRIKAYINVGGGLASLGSSLNAVPIESGLHFDLWKWNFPRAGTLVQLAKEGIPVVHLGNPREIAREFDLPVAPNFMPEVGEGRVLGREAYNVRIAALLLVVYLALTVVLVLPGFRTRIMALRAAQGSADSSIVKGSN